MGQLLAKNRSAYKGGMFETQYEKRNRQEKEVKYTMTSAVVGTGGYSALGSAGVARITSTTVGLPWLTTPARSGSSDPSTLSSSSRLDAIRPVFQRHEAPLPAEIRIWGRRLRH